MTAGATGEAREIRAARNQALFRAVNEKLRTIDEAFEAEDGRQAITCECADLECVQTIEIDRDAYSRVRQTRATSWSSAATSTRRWRSS